MTLLTSTNGDLIQLHNLLEVNGVHYLVEPVECVSG